MSSTKNVKENRKVVTTEYYHKAVYKIPDGLDLADETFVKGWLVRYGTLYIYYQDGREEKIESEFETEPDYKYPDCEIEDAEDYNVEYDEEEGEEEEEDEKTNDKYPTIEEILSNYRARTIRSRSLVGKKNNDEDKEEEKE